MRAHELFEKMAAEKSKSEKNTSYGRRGLLLGAGGLGLNAVAGNDLQQQFGAQMSDADKGLYDTMKSQAPLPVYEKPSWGERLRSLSSAQPTVDPPPGTHDISKLRPEFVNSFPDNNAAFVDAEGHFSKKVVPKITGSDKSFVLMGSELKGNPHVLAHELGHAEFDKTMLGKATQNLPVGQLRNPMLSMGIGAASGALTGMSDNETVQRVGRWAPLALQAPMLMSEAAASLKGHSNLKRLGATAEQLKRYRRTMLPAFGTYAGAAALSPAAAHVAQGATLHHRGELERLRAKQQALSAPAAPEAAGETGGDVKLSSFGAALKQTLLADIGGPKGFVTPISRAVEHGKGGVTKVIRPTTAPKALRSARTAGGAWDVSPQAQRMGL